MCSRCPSSSRQMGHTYSALTRHEQDSPFTHLNRFEDVSGARASNHFQLFQVANETASRPPSPPLQSTPTPLSSQTNSRPSSPIGVHENNVFTPETMAD